MNAAAFNTKMLPFGAKIGAMLSSDIGHWDVIDMRDGRRGGLRSGRGRPYGPPATSATSPSPTPLRFFTDLNPAFFDGTAIEEAANSAFAP